MERPLVAVTMGDPAGIGPEIVLLALARPEVGAAVRALVVGDAGRLEEAADVLLRASRLPSAPRIRAVADPAEARFKPGTVEVVAPAREAAADVRGLPWGQLDARSGRAAFAYVRTAAELAVAGKVDAISTAPINKEAWRLAGIPYPGHTDALAHLAGVGRVAMMLANGRLRVVHVTTHVGLAEAIRQLSQERVLATIELADEALRRLLGRRPHLALAALNPHAGEGGLFGEEETRILRPAVAEARGRGLDVDGPLPADTVFARAAEGQFDAAIALYHDQGHIAVKMLGLDTGVNVTLGLPFLRTSVDHGTAYDIAGRGVAREASMVAALEAVRDLLPGQ
ncbi:MAG: 4-hydroxythreonine-4-phosphate dehydrogenase PdxA [Bacillota bacterium]|nr:4-hydroxythreonine-4-phosphate dehydrogenase PdxA [Bacillota bacterium]